MLKSDSDEAEETRIVISKITIETWEIRCLHILLSAHWLYLEYQLTFYQLWQKEQYLLRNCYDLKEMIFDL